MNYLITAHSGNMRNLNTRSLSISLAFHGILIVLIALFVTNKSLKEKNIQILSASITFSAPTLETKRNENNAIGAAQPTAKKEASHAIISSKGTKKHVAIHQHNDNQIASALVSLGIASGDVEALATHRGLDNRSRPLLLNAQDIKIPYPEQARARRVEGIVKMKLTVAESGKVIEADIISGPAYGLRQAALMVARKLFFLPATDELGRARVAQIEHEVIFRLTTSS